MQLTIMLRFFFLDIYDLFASVRVVECCNLPEVVDATSHHVDSVDFLDCERGVARENQDKNK